MPILEEESLTTEIFTPDQPPIDFDAEQSQAQFSGLFPTIGAAWGMFNPVTSMVVNESTLSILDQYDPEFEPNARGFEEYSHIIAGAKDAEHERRLKNDILRKKKYENTIADGGGFGITASLAASLMDPVGLYTFGAAGKIARTPTKINKMTHVSKSTGKVAVVGAGSTALSEIALQASQPALEAEESFKAIAGGALLGGLLGAAGGVLSKPEFDSLASKLKRDFNNINRTDARQAELNNSILKAYNETSGAGAESVAKLTAEDLELVETFGFAKMSKYITPTLRVMQSSSVVAKRIYVQMAEIPLKMKGSASGKTMPVAAETLAKRYDTHLAKAIVSKDEGYKEIKQAAKERGQKPMSKSQYKTKIAKAMRREDVDVNGDPIITKAAEKIRKQFFNELRDAAIEVELLPKDVEAKFADSYLTRLWSPKDIIANEPVFKKKLTDWAQVRVRKVIADTEAKYIKSGERIQKSIEKDLEVMRNNEQKLKELSERKPVKFDYRTQPSVQDDYLEFLKREIGAQELEAYLARYELEEVAELVHAALQKVPKTPESLTQRIVKLGGIKPDADLKSAKVNRRGLFKEDGMSLDDMVRALADPKEGFFAHMSDDDAGILPNRWDQDYLRQKIIEDIDGGGVFRDDDFYIVSEIERIMQEQSFADGMLSDAGIDNYKNFYKEIYEDVKGTKRGLKKDAQKERARIKAAKQGAREGQKLTKPFRDELKKMRNAQGANLRRANRKLETKIKKSKQLSDDLHLRKKEELDAYFDVTSNNGIDEYVKDIVDEVTDNLAQLKPQAEIPSFIVPTERGPLRGKTLDVNDIEFEEFLDNDIDHIMNVYRHHMGTQIEMKRNLGGIDLKDQLQEVAEEYRVLRENAPDEKTKLKLAKEQKAVIRDIEGVRDVLLGRYNAHNPDEVLNQAGVVLRDLQFMAKMGGVVISSLPDVFRSTMVNGLSRAIPEMEMAQVSKITRGMAIDDLKDLGFGLEAVLASRLQSLAELGDPMNRGTALTRFTGNSAQIFSKVTMINYWNDMHKTYSAIATQNKILRSLDGSDAEYLNRLGISDSHARVIKKQFEKHGTTDGKKIISGAKDWDVKDPNVANAKRVFEAALRKEADVAIVTKGAGDLPLLSNKEAGKLFLQFRNFVMASHTRVTLRALQARGEKEVAGAIMGAVSMVAMGMMVAAIKSEMSRRSAGLRGADKHLDTSKWNKRKWLAEGLDRSGLVALMLEPINISDKAAGLGPSMLTGQGAPSSYAGRNIVGMIGGPSVGTIGDLGLTLRNLGAPITGAELSKSDIYASRRLLPFQNAFIFRQMFDILEAKTGEAVGIQ